MLTKKMAPGLYFVATPIGAARDITLRAMDILQHADLLAAEDTRNTRKLLDIHGIKLGERQIIAYHDHNGAAQRPKILATLAEGKIVAYVSDAGTPMVADPGFALSRAAVADGFDVFAAPGASALLAALCVAGLPTDQFFFAGFAPNKQGARRKFYKSLANIPATMVFYESPNRIHDALNDMLHSLGNRDVAVCRELTKKFETVTRGDLETVITSAEPAIVAKGEFVVVLGPPIQELATDDDILAALAGSLETMRMKDASNDVAERFGISRKRAYELALSLKGTG